MGISPARAEAAAKAMATIEHARRKLAFIRQILRCANRTVLTCWTAVDYTPPAIGKPALACGKSYGAPPRLPATRGVYEIAAPEGSLNPSPTTTVVLGASEDRSESASTSRLPIGAKHAVAPDSFTRVTPAGRSSKIKNRGPGTAVEPVLLRDVLEVQLQARIVNDLAAGNRDCFRNISTACTDGESGKNRAAAVRALTLVSRIGNRYAVQHLAGKGRRQDVFLAVQALAQPVIPDLDRGGVIDRVCIAVVVVIAYPHVPHQRSCSSRAVTAIESDKQIGLRTGMAPHRVEQSENRSDARHADWNSEANGARSKICRCGALPIIVWADRNRKRDASEILVAGWIRASVYDASAVRP